MTPILLGVGAAFAAVFLSGCTDKQKTKESQGATPSSGDGGPLASLPPPAADAGVPSPAAARDYYVSFGTNLRAAGMYQRLSERGVGDEALDRGCKTLFNRHVPTLSQAGDRRIEACEVMDFTLDNYRKYPDVAAILTGKPIPWILDDFDAATPDDNLIRERVQKVITKLQENPALKKLEKGSEEYRKRLGTALAFYVDFPNEYHLIELQRDNLRKQSEVLVEYGLKDFQEELFKEGGLDGMRIAELPGNEWVGGALKAWQTGRGGPGARAKLLYAVLAQAEINPVFILATDKSNSDLFEEATRGTPYLLNFGGRRSPYLQVGISLASTDPATGRPALVRFQGLRPDAGNEANLAAQELSLATFLAMDFHEQADYFLLQSQNNPEIPYKLALNLTPTDSAIFNSSAVLLEKLGNPDQAEIAYKEALRFDPTNGIAAYNLGQLYARQERNEAAVGSFLKAAVWSPSAFAKRAEVIEPVVQKVLAKTPEHQEAKGLASKLKELRAEKPDGG